MTLHLEVCDFHLPTTRAQISWLPTPLLHLCADSCCLYCSFQSRGRGLKSAFLNLWGDNKRFTQHTESHRLMALPTATPASRAVTRGFRGVVQFLIQSLGILFPPFTSW